MGLSSSQARLLSLTGRMHDIEYKAQKLEAQKLQMANESAHVYREYEDALNKTKIQLRFINNDGSAKFEDATYRNLLESGYYIQFADNNILWGKNGPMVDGKVAITQATFDNFNASGMSEDLFVAKQLNIAGASQITTANNTKGYKEIYSAEQLATITGSGNYILMADIDMTGKSWSPKSFSGKLDGNGHTIKGLTDSLFSNLNGATVENLNLDVNINSANQQVGGLARTSSGTTKVNNVNVSGNILATYDAPYSLKSNGNPNPNLYVGGLIGQVAEGAILNADGITSTVNITNTGGQTYGNIGGIIGRGGSDATLTSIQNGVYNGSIIANTNGQVGGIAGASVGTLNNCATDGSIINNSSNGYASGIVGSAWSSNITNCKSEIDLTARNVAGVVMSTGYTDISNCYVNANIHSNNHESFQTEPENDYYYCAGFIGNTADNCSISDSICEGVLQTDLTADATRVDRVVKVAGNLHYSTGVLEVNNVTSNPATLDGDGNALSSKDYGLFKSSITTPISNGQPASESVKYACTASGASTSINERLNTAEAQAQRDTYKMIAAGKYYIDTGDVSPAVGNEDNSSYLTNLINAGLLFLFRTDSNSGDVYQVNVATDTNLQEVSDELDLKKAEAKYEADMRKINNKDKKYDTELAALESERNAIKTEMDTLKTVARDNVDRTFKLFS